MPGKRYNQRWGRARVRIVPRLPGQPELAPGAVFVQLPNGQIYQAPFERLRPIPQKSTTPNNRRRPRRPKRRPHARR